MKSTEAAELIHVISSSLRANPGQFQINISLSGFSAQNTGGVGFQAQNTGGIGFNSNMSNANIQVAQQQTGEAIDARISSLLSKLDAIEDQLRQPTPANGTLKVLAEAIYADKWVPGVITAMVTALLNGI